MHSLRCLLAILTLGLVSCDRSPDPIAVEAGVSAALARHRATVISDLHYRLDLSVPRSADVAIPGRMTIEFRLADASRPLQVDFREAADRLHGGRVNDRTADLEVRDEHLLIPAGLLREGANVIELDFTAGDTSLNRNPDFLYTLFVPDRARTAFPVFDQPDLKGTWDLTLEIPADWTAVSAAPLDTVDTHDGRRTLRFATSDRISSYLFSFVAGNFETITRDVGGRPMTLVHREPDAERVARNVDEIFRLHAAALAWLEEYTGIPFPFRKLDIALLPAHPYGGMEHVGAIQYRAERLWLDAGASDTQLLRRASLIAHEVAHMWFGNLVTMRWFDDVWTKEVFANFMAAKIVNPSFPDIDHDLNFLVGHHPGAYGVDRTAGANAIRQPLDNLNQAGQLYGPIIYDKAPIMMRQLEALLGETAFRDGLRVYLERYAMANATWPELIRILDERTEEDLARWSETWVNTPGRPAFRHVRDEGGARLAQEDPAGRGRLWPQEFAIRSLDDGTRAVRHRARTESDALDASLSTDAAALLFNADGYGYGLFPADPQTLESWRDIDALPLASLLINLQEQMLETGRPTPAAYLPTLIDIAAGTQNQLLLNLALGQLQRIYWTLIPAEQRLARAPELEARLEAALRASGPASLRKIYFKAFAAIALTPGAIERIAEVWSGARTIDNLPLAESDYIELAQVLAIRDPERAEVYLDTQIARTENPDQRRRLAYLAPSLAADRAERDAFFAALADERNRETESWVLDALANLHHPLRVEEAEAYLRPSLELLEEIQATGDIFFPAGWLRATFRHHHSDAALETVDAFLATRPAYNPQLRLKILQATDPLRRANRLRAEAAAAP